MAAARAGFTGLARYWDSRLPDILKMRCMCEPNGRRKGRCRVPLLAAKPVDASRPDGAWQVTKLEAANLDAERHPEHKGGLGTSHWLKKRTEDSIKLCAGDEIPDWRALHTLEGAIKSAARREGRFVSAAIEASTTTTYTFSCALGAQRCSFLVRLRKVADEDEDGRYRRIEVCNKHTCVSEALEPNEKLAWRLSFFPKIQLVNGSTGVPHRTGRSEHREDFLHPIDQRLGKYPVRESGSKPRVSSASSATRPTAPATPSPAAFPAPAAPPSRLAKATSALSTAESGLATASFAVESLKKQLEAAGKDLEAKKALVEKRRKKLQKARRKEKKREATHAGSGEKGEKRRKKEKKREGGQEKKAKA
ncbi:hypothetical protein JCM10213_003073 [Rhodosporidiobolus nylandii]